MSVSMQLTPRSASPSSELVAGAWDWFDLPGPLDGTLDRTPSDVVTLLQMRRLGAWSPELRNDCSPLPAPRPNTWSRDSELSDLLSPMALLLPAAGKLRSSTERACGSASPVGVGPLRGGAIGPQAV
mmetsp:Transcript_32298/g.65246  ORF Transcript_32298/g.65246 Transcript_32298/m.65246 type:complete len:127 (+) Transcript_32298:808-1188(+)